MSDVTWKYHPKNPANQVFNVTARKNKTKQKAWFQVGNSNNKSVKKVSKTEE